MVTNPEKDQLDMTSAAMKSFSVKLPDETREELDLYAQLLERSRNWVINEAVKQFLEVQRAQIALIKERVQEANRPDAEFISHEQVMADVEALLNEQSK
jgi:predicted transcriptional regulator